MDTAQIQKTIREYHEQLYANKFGKLKEIDNFLETYSLPKLNQEEIDQLDMGLRWQNRTGAQLLS